VSKEQEHSAGEENRAVSFATNSLRLAINATNMGLFNISFLFSPSQNLQSTELKRAKMNRKLIF